MRHFDFVGRCRVVNVINWNLDFPSKKEEIKNVCCDDWIGTKMDAMLFSKQADSVGKTS